VTFSPTLEGPPSRGGWGGGSTPGGGRTTPILRRSSTRTTSPATERPEVRQPRTPQARRRGREDSRPLAPPPHPPGQGPLRGQEEPKHAQDFSIVHGQHKASPGSSLSSRSGPECRSDEEKQESLEERRGRSVGPRDTGREMVSVERRGRSAEGRSGERRSLETLWREVQALDTSRVTWEPLVSPTRTDISPSYISPSPRMARAAALRAPRPTSPPPIPCPVPPSHHNGSVPSTSSRSVPSPPQASPPPLALSGHRQEPYSGVVGVKELLKKSESGHVNLHNSVAIQSNGFSSSSKVQQRQSDHEQPSKMKSSQSAPLAISEADAVGACCRDVCTQTENSKRGCKVM